MLERLIELDTKLFLWLNSFHSPFWDKIMVFISGKVEWAPLYLLLLIWLALKFRWRSLWILLAIGVLITLADQISTEVLKKGVERLRPSNDPTISSFVHIVNDYRGGSFGFVSSHAANSFAIATFFSLVAKRKWVTISIVLWAGIVSYSRIYLGVHYPGDILGGALLGSLLAFTVYYILNFVLNKLYSSKTL